MCNFRQINSLQILFLGEFLYFVSNIVTIPKYRFFSLWPLWGLGPHTDIHSTSHLSYLGIWEAPKIKVPKCPSVPCPWSATHPAPQSALLQSSHFSRWALICPAAHARIRTPPLLTPNSIHFTSVNFTSGVVFKERRKTKDNSRQQFPVS